MRHTPETILEAVSEYYSVPTELIQSKLRTLQVVHARSVCAYLFRKLTYIGVTRIPNYFEAYSDHTAPSRAITKIKGEIRLSKAFNTCNEIPEIIQLSLNKSSLLSLTNSIINN